MDLEGMKSKLEKIEGKLTYHISEMFRIKWKIEKLEEGEDIEEIEKKTPIQKKKNICRSKLINLAEIELKAIERNNRSGKSWIKMRRKVVGKDGS